MSFIYPNQDIYPYNVVVFIEVDWSDGTSTRGSGAIVGRNDVLTAAHVVHDPFKTITAMSIHPAYDGAAGPWGTYSGFFEWRYFNFNFDYSYQTNTLAEAAWDLAIIGLASPIGDQTGYLGWSSFAGPGFYTVMGYPAATGERLVRDDGFLGVIGNGSDAVFDLSTVYVSGGSSGGPIVNRNNQVVGVVSTSGAGNRIDGEIDTLVAYMAENDALLRPGATSDLQFSLTFTASNTSTKISPNAYIGPVKHLTYQYLGSAADEAIAGTSRNDFVNALGGQDAVHGGGGDDVIDGGLGSNFLTGGSGRDVFFLDGRGGGVTWSTITDWSFGEELSVWGFRLGRSKLTWVDNAGAPGFQGRTLHCDLDGNGTIDTSVTWSGWGLSIPRPLERDGLLWFT